MIKNLDPSTHCSRYDDRFFPCWQLQQTDHLVRVKVTNKQYMSAHLGIWLIPFALYAYSVMNREGGHTSRTTLPTSLICFCLSFRRANITAYVCRKAYCGANED